MRVVLVGLYGDRSFGTAAGSKVSRANPVVAIVYGAGVGHDGGQWTVATVNLDREQHARRYRPGQRHA